MKIHTKTLQTNPQTPKNQAKNQKHTSLLPAMRGTTALHGGGRCPPRCHPTPRPRSNEATRWARHLGCELDGWMVRMEKKETGELVFFCSVSKQNQKPKNSAVLILFGCASLLSFQLPVTVLSWLLQQAHKELLVNSLPRLVVYGRPRWLHHGGFRFLS